jgi:hypothetical protein
MAQHQRKLVVVSIKPLSVRARYEIVNDIPERTYDNKIRPTVTDMTIHATRSGSLMQFPFLRVHVLQLVELIRTPFLRIEV